MLDNFDEYTVECDSKNVMFCLCRNNAEVHKKDKNEYGQINMSLECIQKDLISEWNEGMQISKAFVYGMDRIYVKPFADCNIDTTYYYSNKKCDKTLSISQILIIALELLQAQSEENQYEENQLYVILDGEYSVVEGKKIYAILTEFAQKFSFEPVFVLNEVSEQGSILEEYITKEGKLYRFSDFQRNKVIGG